MDTILMIRSLTYAQRSQRLLERRGIRTGILRSPAELTPEGCGYALRLAGGNLADARLLLEREGLRPGKAYKRQADGAWKEVLP